MAIRKSTLSFERSLKKSIAQQVNSLLYDFGINSAQPLMQYISTEVDTMIYGYIRAGISIPEGIRIPMETLLDANYRSYIKVLEDEVSKTITVYFENGKQTFPFRNEGPMMNDRCNAIKEFVDALQTNSVTEKIVFKGLSTLGTIAEAKELYWYMIQRRVNVEFIDTPIANTARYFGIIERLPYQTQILAFEELDFSYKREIALNELGWYEFTPTSYSSQLSRKQKKSHDDSVQE